MKGLGFSLMVVGSIAISGGIRDYSFFRELIGVVVLTIGACMMGIV